VPNSIYFNGFLGSGRRLSAVYDIRLIEHNPVEPRAGSLPRSPDEAEGRNLMADKAFYKIGEACKSLDIQPYVLRYWETEFPILKSDATQSGQRVYSKDDLAVIRRIKELLYDEGFTIAGAKKKLEAERDDGLQLTLDAAPAAAPEPAAKPAEKPAAEKKAKPKPAAKKAAEKAEETSTAEEKKPEPKSEAKAEPAEEPKPEKKADTPKKAPKKAAKKAEKAAAKKEESDHGAAAIAEAQAEARETQKRAEKLERGIRSALDEARAILSILEADPAEQPSAKK